MTTTSPRGVRTLSPSWLLAVLTLLAVFAMHGPSSGHSMLMPHGGGEYATMPVTIPATMTATHRPADETAPTPPTSTVGDHVMTHGECLATLRADPGRVITAAAIVTTHASTAVGARAAPAAAVDRPPPRPPDLERLCISRT